MKKVTFIFLFATTFAFAQNIPTSDFIQRDEIQLNDGKFHIEKKILLENGENENVPVKLDFFGTTETLKFDLKKIDKIISVASDNAKNRLKSASSYRPTSIVIRPIDENSWYVNLFFSGQNDFGAKKDSSAMLKIDNEGNILKDL